MKKVGIVFGCFIPLHEGHVKSMIRPALEQNDEIILGVCGYDEDRGKLFLPFRKRIELMQKKYKKNKKVTISVVDDRKIGLTGTFSEEAWRIWSNELFRNAGYNENEEDIAYTWYTGEDSYIEKLEKIFPHHKFKKLDRGEINISGTEIRNDPKKYVDVIDKTFRDYLKEQKLI